ncbi:MAG TPA: flagellar export protein FliJ [Zoogloea sp.]|uniref:flagellar export protein FliJ n=1 Tax=Zoogloea sp. TaxID=49181 RepID=UPI002C7D8BE6|nr:flagellar export protein FliJ [Zoogloea sp.]HMV61930.1 flagellar export protein FliJ [Rhodocyclaceae bacterium]HMW50664.1 flagellar export protein FliJ [Rhodocyclaceae bacterium]HMY49332.1 flagellar export protein FliJ [Rhodocyclaceae bacterium]HMZ74742.1 flagellar export protein FliJ [Rhodocyclaceae bacterium]HNA66938.1 flagellar export protein FliJ [Rhodocyclaceae bacterium]
MTEPFPLKPLLDLANTRMDEAARRLGELIASEHAVEEKLALLKDYRDEYQARFMEAARNGIGPDAWRNYSAFIARLDDAIAQQQKLASDSRRRTEQGQQAWRDERNKVKAFDTLSQRHHTAQLRKELKQEQRLTDEHAAKHFRDRDADDDGEP